jgi:CheY-like chemotaxis protein
MPPVAVSPLHILCAEDDRFFRDAVTGLLESAGHRVCAAENGPAARDILLEEMDCIDVVVTDHQMPGFTGLELVQLLRQTTFRGRIYVYASLLKPAEEHGYRGLRVDGIFSKNIALTELLRVVENARPTAPSEISQPISRTQP